MANGSREWEKGENLLNSHKEKETRSKEAGRGGGHMKEMVGGGHKCLEICAMLQFCPVDGSEK